MTFYLCAPWRLAARFRAILLPMHPMGRLSHARQAVNVRASATRRQKLPILQDIHVTRPSSDERPDRRLWIMDEPCQLPRRQVTEVHWSTEAVAAQEYVLCVLGINRAHAPKGKGLIWHQPSPTRGAGLWSQLVDYVTPLQSRLHAETTELLKGRRRFLQLEMLTLSVHRRRQAPMAMALH